MGKAPAFQFYIRDWLADPLLKMVCHQTKGIWIDILCYLWESPDRGKLEGKDEQFIKMLSCTTQEWETFCADASVTKFADVTKSNGIVTVCNRRMYREEKYRKNTRIRVNRFRAKRKSNASSNAPVTPPSSSSSSKEIKKESFMTLAKEVLKYLNFAGKKNFTPTKANLEPIIARLKEGHTEEECKTVIEKKNRDPDFNDKYFRPSTLFGPSKFEGYLNEREKEKVW
uniref:Putative replication protein n=1 Tax=viral metagenome TaxID=1070528 RepID=A0A6M3LIK8_9ZZZZ